MNNLVFTVGTLSLLLIVPNCGGRKPVIVAEPAQITAPRHTVNKEVDVEAVIVAPVVEEPIAVAQQEEAVEFVPAQEELVAEAEVTSEKEVMVS